MAAWNHIVGLVLGVYFLYLGDRSSRAMMSCLWTFLAWIIKEWAFLCIISFNFRRNLRVISIEARSSTTAPLVFLPVRINPLLQGSFTCWFNETWSWFKSWRFRPIFISEDKFGIRTNFALGIVGGLLFGDGRASLCFEHHSISVIGMAFWLFNIVALGKNFVGWRGDLSLPRAAWLFSGGVVVGLLSNWWISLADIWFFYERRGVAVWGLIVLIIFIYFWGFSFTRTRHILQTIFQLLFAQPMWSPSPWRDLWLEVVFWMKRTLFLRKFWIKRT